MNPLVSEMLGVSARNDLEVTFLEELLNDDCKCQSREHEFSPCSVTVTHLFTACYVRSGKPVCETAASEIEMYQNNGAICQVCDGRIWDCWTIRPI